MISMLKIHGRVMEIQDSRPTSTLHQITKNQMY